MSDGAGSALDPTDLARAEAALARLAADYQIWLAADLDAMRACQGQADGAERLYRLAHDVKGQAATFGFALVGTIAGRLCALLRSERGANGRVGAHLDAMTEALALGPNGADAGTERNLLSRLD